MNQFLRSASLTACLCLAAIGFVGAPVRATGLMLPYPLHTSGSQIVDSNGTPVRIAGVGWDWVHSGNSVPSSINIAGYKPMFQALVANGINCVRICTCDKDVNNDPIITSLDAAKNPDIANHHYNEILQIMVNYGGSIGLKFIIESHNNEGTNNVNWGAQNPRGFWYDLGVPGGDGTDGGGNVATISNATFLSLWQKRANLFVGNTNVIGYDIVNEPLYGYGLTWGSGNSATDLRMMYQNVGNAILAIDPNKLIFCEGIIQWAPQNSGYPDEDLRPAATYPVNLNVANQLVYSVHPYPNEVNGYTTADTGQSYYDRQTTQWGWLVKNNVAPVWIGEFGDNMRTSDGTGNVNALIAYFNGLAGGGPTFSGNQQGVSWSWWSLEAVQTVGVPNFGILNAACTDVDATEKTYWNQIVYVAKAGSAANIAAGTAAIDGTAEAAWNNATAYSITKITGTVSSTADLSGTWKGMWDTTNLYLLADVTDDVKKNESVNVWDDDAVELFVDGNNNKTSTYDTNDRQLVFGWGDAAVVEPGGRSTTGVTFAKADPTTTTYRIEAKVPWSTLGVTASNGKLIGIDVHIDDDDDGAARDGKKAWNDGTDSAWGNPSVFGTGTLQSAPTVPAVPTGVTASAGNAQVTVSWNASSGATAYDVKRSTVSGSGYAVVSSPASTSFTNTGLTNGTTYYYVVVAKNAAGSSANSGQVSGTPSASPWNPALWYRFICHTSGFAADNNGSTTAGTNIIQQTTATGYWNQEFHIISDGDGYYHLVNHTSGLALDCNGSTAAGAVMVQKANNPGWWDQEWQIVADGTYYHFINRTSGLALDCNASTTAGTNMVQKTYNAGWWDQQFQIVQD